MEAAAELQAQRTDNRRLRDEITALEDRRGEMVSQATALETRIKEAEAELENQRDERTQLNDTISNLEQRRTELDKEASALAAEIEQTRSNSTNHEGATQGDPLVDLSALPPVLEGLRDRMKQAPESEAEALLRVSNHLKALGLSYSDRVVRAFHTAMKVNESTQMAVLAGISGTGKSQLPRRYAEAIGIGFLQVPVQPRWDSPQDLMGFYNYIESRFRPTDMARALYHMDQWNGPEDSRTLQDRMLLVLLDEMNLARVEYYFSDFLSRLESRPTRAQAKQSTARKDAEIELDIPATQGGTPPRIFPGYNVLFAGTMNEDESTQSLSDKVVDRANVLRFAAPRTITTLTREPTGAEPKALSRQQWEEWLRDVDSLGADQAHVENRLNTIADLMRDLQRPIGHRLGGAILAYIANYPKTGSTRNLDVPLADQIEMRLLPKLRGVEIDAVGPGMDSLSRYVEDELKDAELAHAIRESVIASESTGQFVWRGVARE